MKLSDREGWRTFTYTQLYPAILGSMLYGVLEWSERTMTQQLVALSVTALLIIDYLHLYQDLKAPDQAQGWEIRLDALFAILLGIAFWQIKHDVARAAVVLGVTVALLIAYTLRKSADDWTKLGVLVTMFLCTGLLFGVAKSNWGDGWIVGASWSMTTIYAIYVFRWRPRAGSQVQAGVAGAAIS